MAEEVCLTAMEGLALLLRGNGAAALTLAGVLPLAAVIAFFATTLALAGVHALAIVLGGLSLLGAGLWFVILSEGSACGQTCDSRAECDPKLSAIHVFSFVTVWPKTGAFVDCTL